MSLIDIETTSYPKQQQHLPNILMSFNQQNTTESTKPSGSPSNATNTSTTTTTHEFPNLGTYSSSICNGGGQTTTPNYGYNPSNDANKAFDDVVFDILKVDPDDVAGQLTLIDLPLFKQIQPDELISCKWMSREKQVKAPNIVQFTRRFNQTTFWAQKEILNCKRIETRGKMITKFIKMAKRLNELHSFNSLMAIIVALKAQPIYRLKKTWTNYVSKRDVAQFERLADTMFDTNDNKRKVRDIHMNCKLPCIPFLGLFLTDLIHIDIAHPHNSFDNPQRRNQMNNICRLISEYQQSNYQDLTSINCDCCFTIVITTPTQNEPEHLSLQNNHQSDQALPGIVSTPTDTKKCLVPNCDCLIHHGQVSGAGIINSDGTIYINEIDYIKNYLNSFLYIEELQKFKEDENYRDSLELEALEMPSLPANRAGGTTDKLLDTYDCLKKPILHVSPSSPGNMVNSSGAIGADVNRNSVKSLHYQQQPVCMDPNNNQNNNGNNNNGQPNKRCQTVASNLFNFNLVNSESKDLSKQHPLDESIENSDQVGSNSTASCSAPSSHPASLSQATHTTNDLLNEMPMTSLQQKQLLASVRINDPSSLLRELLKHRHHTTTGIILPSKPTPVSTSTLNPSISFKNKFNCYSSSNADVDDESNGGDDSQNSDLDGDPNSLSIDHEHNPIIHNNPDSANSINNSTPIKQFNSSLENTNTNSSDKSNQMKGNNNNKKNVKNKAKKKLLNSTLKSKSIGSDASFVANGSGEINNSDSIRTRLNGRNLIDSLTEDTDTVDSSCNNNHRNNIGYNNMPYTNNPSKTSSSSDLFQHNNPSHSQCTDDASYRSHDLSGITHLSNVLALEQQMGLIMFESPVKRKCIMKNFRKPRFSQWKSYWLQLIGGNLLIYYPIKSIMFNANLSNKRDNEASSYIDELISNQTETSLTDNPDIHQLHQEMQQQQKKERLQARLEQKKVCYNKNPCKMHPIANWMVVDLYRDKEDEMVQVARKMSLTAAGHRDGTNYPTINRSNNNNSNNVSGSSSSLDLSGYTKFDIQLNDLNNGNMYKYRFDSLQVAKEWLEQFKLASTYHEREKPDNLIRFD